MTASTELRMHRWVSAAAAVVCTLAVGAVCWGLLAHRPAVVLGAFSTDLSNRTDQQMVNIRRAVCLLNGAVIHPGGEFSFNARVGPCTAARGFVPAPTIVAGELAETPGGGVCQVSSTLYNAVLLSGLQIVERHPHSRPPLSVPPGRDAAVFAPNLDLRFQNDTNSKIVVQATISANKLICRIVGASKPKELFSLAVETAEARRSGRPVLVARLWRIKYARGKEIAREMISEDIYRI